MSNLTSTVPGAFDALYNLLLAAGQAQAPKVQVLPQALTTYEPGSYVLLGIRPDGSPGIEGHRFSPAALGSYAHEEDYDICGYVTVLQGDVEPETILPATWALYQTVVMTPLVASRGSGGQPVLGSAAPASVQWALPTNAAYTSSPGSFGGAQAGFQGTIEFCVSVHARITVP